MKEWGSDILVTGIPAVLYFQCGKAKQAPMDSNTKEWIIGLNSKCGSANDFISGHGPCHSILGICEFVCVHLGQLTY